VIGVFDDVVWRLGMVMGMGLDDVVLVVDDAVGIVCVDVLCECWYDALVVVCEVFGLDFFDWLSGVDEFVVDLLFVDVVVYLVVLRLGGDGIGDSVGLV